MSTPEELTRQAREAIANATGVDGLEAIAADYLGRKNGLITRLLAGIGKLEPAERAALGQAANEAKRAIDGILEPGVRRSSTDMLKVGILGVGTIEKILATAIRDR